MSLFVFQSYRWCPFLVAIQVTAIARALQDIKAPNKNRYHVGFGNLLERDNQNQTLPAEVRLAAKGADRKSSSAIC